MLSSRLQHLAEGGGRRLGAAVEDGKVQVGRVAVVGKVDETKSGAAFEDEPSAVFRSGVVKLGDDMGEFVVPLHDGVSTPSVSARRVRAWRVSTVNSRRPLVVRLRLCSRPPGRRRRAQVTFLAAGVEADHRLPAPDGRVELEREIEYLGERGEATLPASPRGPKALASSESRSGLAPDAPLTKASASRSTPPVRSTRRAHSNSARSRVERHECPSRSASRWMVSARSMTTRSGRRLMAGTRTCVVQATVIVRTGWLSNPRSARALR